MEKINLEELFDNNYDCYTEFDLNQSHSDEAPAMTKEKFKEIIINYSKQLLELAADNAKINVYKENFIRYNSHEVEVEDSFDYTDYNDNGPDFYFNVIPNRESITSVIDNIL